MSFETCSTCLAYQKREKLCLKIVPKPMQIMLAMAMNEWLLRQLVSIKFVMLHLLHDFIHKTNFSTMSIFSLRYLKSNTLWRTLKPKPNNKGRSSFRGSSISPFGGKTSTWSPRTTNFSVYTMGWRCQIESAKTRWNTICSNSSVRQRHLLFTSQYHTSVPNCNGCHFDCLAFAA